MKHIRPLPRRAFAEAGRNTPFADIAIRLLTGLEAFKTGKLTRR
ncbi:MAG TPA: hypothetical protein PLO62_00275 [Candidatus Hydrogenedentes bacterium]|nr:hypothetical protein [Candidatus Hydrogenedentota bacterium]